MYGVYKNGGMGTIELDIEFPIKMISVSIASSIELEATATAVVNAVDGPNPKENPGAIITANTGVAIATSVKIGASSSTIIKITLSATSFGEGMLATKPISATIVAGTRRHKSVTGDVTETPYP